MPDPVHPERPNPTTGSGRGHRAVNIGARLLLAFIVANLVAREFPDRAESWGSPLLVLIGWAVIWVVVSVAVFTFTGDDTINWLRARLSARR